MSVIRERLDVIKIAILAIAKLVTAIARATHREGSDEAEL
jgi:hypothetical protein